MPAGINIAEYVAGLHISVTPGYELISQTLWQHRKPVEPHYIGQLRNPTLKQYSSTPANLPYRGLIRWTKL